MNAVGTGMAYPFVVIYLHNVRGFSLGISGLIVAASGAAGIVCGPAIGVVIDKIGGRLTLAGALILQAVGWGSFPLVQRAVARGSAPRSWRESGTRASGRASPRSWPA